MVRIRHGSITNVFDLDYDGIGFFQSDRLLPDYPDAMEICWVRLPGSDNLGQPGTQAQSDPGMRGLRDPYCFGL